MSESRQPGRQVRHPTQMVARVLQPDGSELEAKVVDFSLEGCCLAMPARVGDFVTVVLPRIGRMRGQVRWIAGGRAGILFVRSEGLV